MASSAESRQIAIDTRFADPDALARYHRALLSESAARAEYMRILRIYTDLVVSGKRPEE